MERYDRTTGKAGFKIWRFRLVKLQSEAQEHGSEAKVKTAETIVQRVVRDTKQGKAVKEVYNYCCQICGVRLMGVAGPYAEAAHIRPLGTPYHGPDSLDNLLCLCPNHHVLLDYGGIAILDDLTLLGAEGVLTVHPKHKINRSHLQYHRSHFYRGI